MRTFICLAAAAMASAVPAHSAVTVLTFNTNEVACASVDGAAATQACTISSVGGPNPQFIGADYGSSANLTVSYDASEPDPGTGPRTSLHFNTAGGGLATTFPFGPADELSRIFFTPAAGFEVSFRSFDFRRLSATFGGSFVFRLSDPDGDVLFTGGNAANQTTGSFTWESAYFAGPLLFEFGNGAQGAVGVDNITVDVRAIATVSPVPEPGAWAMMILGFGAVGFAARRAKVAKVSFA